MPLEKHNDLLSNTVTDGHSQLETEFELVIHYYVLALDKKHI